MDFWTRASECNKHYHYAITQTPPTRTAHNRNFAHAISKRAPPFPPPPFGARGHVCFGDIDAGRDLCALDRTVRSDQTFA